MFTHISPTISHIGHTHSAHMSHTSHHRQAQFTLAGTHTQVTSTSSFTSSPTRLFPSTFSQGLPSLARQAQSSRTPGAATAQFPSIAMAPVFQHPKRLGKLSFRNFTFPRSLATPLVRPQSTCTGHPSDISRRGQHFQLRGHHKQHPRDIDCTHVGATQRYYRTSTHPPVANRATGTLPHTGFSPAGFAPHAQLWGATTTPSWELHPSHHQRAYHTAGATGRKTTHT